MSPESALPKVKTFKARESMITYLLASSALYLFFISDALNKTFLYLELDFTRVSVVARSLYEALFFIVIIVFSTKKRVYFLSFFVMLTLFFITGQVIFSSMVAYDYGYLENLIIYNKYLFVIITYYTFYKLPDHEILFKKLIKFLENLFLINAIAAIIGYIFKIVLFKTYLDQDYRYGYSGFIPAQNEATLFYFIGLSYFYYKAFIRQEKNILFWLFAMSALLLGTKAIYIYLAFLLGFHFLNSSTFKAKLVTSLVVISFILGSIWFLKSEISVELLSYFTSKVEESGWLEMVLSGRNISLETNGMSLIKDWSFINYLIGGQDQEKFLIEMDLFDLFFFMGIIGSFSYLSLYFSTLFRFSLKRPFNLFFVLTFFGLATFGGHFFSSAINALYLCLVCLYFYDSEQGTRLQGA